jgi:3-hydroxyisobutyrate dehydrogenase-like beta-hydroxyacid dehydrogenase
MDVGFIGLGNMGFPMARRLIQEDHNVIAFDARGAALERIVALGARAASSPKEVADRAETVMASLPSPPASIEVATGTAGVIEGSRVKRDVDLSTVGSQTAVRIHDRLAERNIVAMDSPVSGGVAVKAGLDPAVMIDVLNAGSGATSASRDKFPRAILPRTFDYGFATALMVKDVRLYLDEAEALRVPIEIAETIGRLWEAAARDQGPDSDFTTVIKPFEQAAGVTVGPVGGRPSGQLS